VIPDPRVRVGLDVVTGQRAQLRPRVEKTRPAGDDGSDVVTRRCGGERGERVGRLGIEHGLGRAGRRKTHFGHASDSNHEPRYDGHVPILVLIFIVVPIAELAVLIKVGSVIGALNTIALLIAVSVVGGWLVKREGLSVLQRIREQVNNGRVPGAELLDAFLVLLAGALLITPGFLSDVLGIFLLLPPVRALVRRRLRRRFETRVITLRPR